MVHRGKIFTRLLIAVALLFLIPASHAQEGEADTPDLLDSRHRIDMAAVFFDSEESDSLIGLFGYTYNLGPKSNLGFEISYLDSNFDENGGSGFGDMSATWSWVPFVPISAGPWVPKRVGSGISILLPTGNTSDGRSLDTTIITPFLGLVVPISDSTFSILPSLSYSYSTDTSVFGEDIRIGIADVGLNWVSDKNLWADFSISYIKDYEGHDTHSNIRISLGTVFSNGLGLSVMVTDLEFFVPGSLPGSEARFEQEYSINLHYNF
jgi:hypothetical protein